VQIVSNDVNLADCVEDLAENSRKTPHFKVFFGRFGRVGAVWVFQVNLQTGFGHFGRFGRFWTISVRFCDMNCQELLNCRIP
jgi:hypothetical protein